MTANVGTLDRLLRALLGGVLIALAFASGLPLFESGLMKYGAAIVGLVLLLTAATRTCPAYTLLGVRTCRR